VNMNLQITYKIVNEFDAPRNEGHVLVFRRVGGEDQQWDLVTPKYSRRSGYSSEEDARSAIDTAIRADKAAATRLGITLVANTQGPG